jgi:hypothetical protein
MDYQGIYDRLIERARGRKLSGYSERHHVLPRCMGGGNSRENIVRLTPEEHYVAHLLLVKIHPRNFRLLWAASSMTGANRRQQARKNKLYGCLRRRLSDGMRERSSGRTASAEARAKMSASRQGKRRGPHSVETREKLSLAAKGRRKSIAHKAALRAAKLGKKRVPHSADVRRRISESNKAAVSRRDYSSLKDPTYRLKQSEKMRQIWAERKQNASCLEP